MRRVLVSLAVLGMFAFLALGCSDIDRPLSNDIFTLNTARVAAGSGPPLCAQEVNLIAGRTTPIGTVRCWIKGDSLHVLYSATGGWVLSATQLGVVGSRVDFPLTKKGNPKIGHFPLKQDHEPPTADVHYVLDLKTWKLESAGELFIAAHAEALLPAAGGGVDREEGAWAEGTRFVHQAGAGSDHLEKPSNTKTDPPVILDDDSEDSGNWSMYFGVDPLRIKVNELVINEIFFAGSCASSFYFYDQFVELYNPSDETLYLDGMVVTRQAQTVDPDVEQVDFVRAIYAYQFPGTPVTGREHPVAPGQFVVIAADGVNHTAFCAASVDLSTADWECYNQLSSDYDNTAVPNLLNIVPTVSVDYMLNLTHNAVVIATGEDISLVPTLSGGTEVRIPLRTVIDGVEYSTNAAASKQLTLRVDAGFAGEGVLRYSAYSTERKIAGLDTDNSSFDFMVMMHPTPGWQHAQ